MVAGGGCFAVWAGCGFKCKLWKHVAALQFPRLSYLRVCCMGLKGVKSALFTSSVVLHLCCTCEQIKLQIAACPDGCALFALEAAHTHSSAHHKMLRWLERPKFAASRLINIRKQLPLTSYISTHSSALQ